jgi:aminocarboxymuconate-semialdehyde decarboxylase
MCRYLNDFIARVVESSPLHFYGLGIVPLQDPDLAAKELPSLKAAGLLGIELGSNVLGASLGEDKFLPFFQEVERQNLSVFVHALHPTFADRFVGPAWLDNSIGFPMDTGLTIASLLTGHTLDQCPNLRLAFSHGGGTFPWVLPRMQQAWSGSWNGEPPIDGPHAAPRPLQQLLPRSPLDYARTLYYDTLVFDHRAIRYLRDLVGTRQLMVGTDYPFIPREEPIGKTLSTIGLAADEWEDVCCRTALRFLGLEE